MSTDKPAKKARHDNGEGYASACIAHELGATVTKHDDGSRSGMHDLEVHYADGTRGAVEVTTCTDGKAQALWNATTGVKNWVEATLKLSWIGRFKRGCKLGPKWKPRLVKLLHTLEAAKVDSLEIIHDWRDEVDESRRTRLSTLFP